MRRIVFINACVRPESRTLLLAKRVLQQIESNIEEVNLEQANISPLNKVTLSERNACIRNKDFSAPIFQYAGQFAEADEIVVAAPYWDLSFPSTIKIYFEAVTVNGLTFRYTPESRPEGLCKARRIIYVTTAGGPIQDCNLGFDYVKALAHTFYGIPEVLCYKAENLDIVCADVQNILQKTLEEIENACHSEQSERSPATER